jgi:glycosyltransferase involved in cell wall biosynthesis
MNNGNLPLVSCLCVTRDKSHYLPRAVECFLSQTYSNKELVILYEDDDDKTRARLATIRHDNVRCVEVPASPKMSLGELRNVSVNSARGEYICQWDDDDWYHEARLEYQLDYLLRSHKAACILSYWLMYDVAGNCALLSGMGPWPGSILCEKRIFSHAQYPSVNRHEDTKFLINIFDYNFAIPMIMPSLYIYVYHGQNTFNAKHFYTLFSRSQVLPAEYAELFRKILNGDISHSEASRLLMSEDALSELDYFQQYREEE